MTTLFLEAAHWVLLAALCWWFYGPYRRYCVDRTRYRLFVIRDRLFDTAAHGHLVEFDCRAYGIVRTTLNGMLRDLEEFNAIRLVTLAFRASRRDTAWRRMCARHRVEYRRALRELSPAGRQRVRDTVDEAVREMHHYVIATSALALLLYVIVVPWHRWLVSSASIQEGYVKHIRHIRRINKLNRIATSYESNIAGHIRWQPNTPEVVV